MDFSCASYIHRQYGYYTVTIVTNTTAQFNDNQTIGAALNFFRVVHVMRVRVSFQIVNGQGLCSDAEQTPD